MTSFFGKIFFYINYVILESLFNIFGSSRSKSKFLRINYPRIALLQKKKQDENNYIVVWSYNSGQSCIGIFKIFLHFSICSFVDDLKTSDDTFQVTGNLLITLKNTKMRPFFLLQDIYHNEADPFESSVSLPSKTRYPEVESSLTMAAILSKRKTNSSSISITKLNDKIK